MSSKIKKQMQRAKNKGLTNAQFAMLQQSAGIHAEIAARAMRKEIEAEAVEKGFVLAMTICSNVLLADYWQKTGEKRMPEFLGQCYSLFESFMEGACDYSDCIAYVEEMSKTTVETTWCKLKNGDASKIALLRK